MPYLIYSEHISYDISENINNMRISNPQKIIGHLNINSMRTKIDELKEIIKGIDICAVNWTILSQYHNLILTVLGKSFGKINQPNVGHISTYKDRYTMQTDKFLFS